MEQLDRVGVRVTLAGCLGGIAGVLHAMLRGHPMVRIASLTAFSWALTGTACFGAERISSLSTRQYLLEHLSLSPMQCTLVSHAMGGAVGGSLLGFLYIRKPLHGIAFFVPLMLVIGTGEQLLDDMRQERIQELNKLEEKAGRLRR